MVPRPFACRYLWAPMFQAAKHALNVQTDESGTVAVRPFLTLACDMYRDDHASGSIAPEVGRSADNPLILTLMFDGFPLEKQSLEHMCLSKASVHDGIALHSEASLRCGLVAGTKETNAGLARLFEMPGVGADLNTIAAGTVCMPCPEGILHTKLNISADRKALEALRGSGPCSSWCRDCGRAVQHILPWARSAHPPPTMVEYRQRKSKLVQVVGKDGRKEWKGCTRTFFTNAEAREAGHVAQQGQELPIFCRWCRKVPYASVPEMEAAKARTLRLKASPNKKDRAMHDKERSAFAATHAHQHEFSYLWLNVDMDDVVPEWMHVLDLNNAYLFFKHVTLKHCDPFTREWIAHFHTGLGAALDTKKKESGRAGQRWHKASTWCELAQGSSNFPGGLRCWFPCLVLLIGDCMRDAVEQGGEHTSVDPIVATVAAAAAANAPPPSRYTVRQDSDDDSSPPPAAPAASAPPAVQKGLTAAMELYYGKSKAKTLLAILDGNESYYQFHIHSHLPGPTSSAPQDERDAHALQFAVLAVDAFHCVEASNPDHKSWMPHITWAVMPEFLADGRSWQHCTGKLEARGAAAKRIGRSVVCWRKQKSAECRRYIKKRGTIKQRKAGTPPAGEGSPFSQGYSSSGHRQVLENIGLREQLLRAQTTRKSKKLSQLGRIQSPRQTQKLEAESLYASHACPFTCREMFEHMFFGRFARLYDVHGVKDPAAWERYRKRVHDFAMG